VQLIERHGKYSAECFYTDPKTGKRKRVLRATGIRVDGSEESKRTAEHRGREIEAELNGALGTARARRSRGRGATTFALAIAAAVEAATLAGSSKEACAAIIRNAKRPLRFFGPDRDPWDIDDEALKSYAVYARESRKAASVLREIAAVRTALKAAKVDPMPKSPRIGGVKARELAFNADELRRLLDAVPAGRDWDASWPTRHDYLRVYMGLGLSYKELYGIDIQGINWERSTVRVRGTKRESRDRVMPMNATVSGALRRAEAAMKARGDRQLFPRWRNVDVNRVLSQAAQLAKLVPDAGRCSVNVLRASFATELVRAGVHPKKIAMLMGHRSTKTADRWYMRLRADEDLHDAVAVLPEL
jgi:site-specific recombinase XerD